MTTENPGVWIAIDGRDAVGKTTQVKLVADELRRQGIGPVIEIPEFSNSPIGNTIREILNRQRFYALKSDSSSPLADTSLLAADMVFSWENEIRPILKAGGVALSDRGPASFVAYQAVRIAERSPDFNLERAVDWCCNTMRVSGMRPDLTLLVEISDVEMARRVVAREGLPLSTGDTKFLRQVEELLPPAAKVLSRDYAVVSGEVKQSNVTKQIVEAVLPIVRKV